MAVRTAASLRQKPIGVIDQIIAMPSRTWCRQRSGSESAPPRHRGQIKGTCRHGGTKTLTIDILGRVHRCSAVNSGVPARILESAVFSIGRVSN